jgi:uncharacterized membrane protein YphA (DoxX/SURF4 family)
MKKPLSYHLLRLGLGITFIAIGVLIFMDPAGWGALIQPWAARLMPVPVVLVMQSTAALDVVIGVFLLIDAFVWAAAALGALHLVTVLITVGIRGETVRDIGLMAACFSLSLSVWPERLRFWMKNKDVKVI